MLTFVLTTPANAGSIIKPVTVSSLAVTGAVLNTTPPLAQIGTAQLEVTLTDTVSGWQETISYMDSSVPTFFAQAAPTPPSGTSLQDIMSELLFNKMIADGKLPAGTLTWSTAVALAASTASAAPGTSITLTATLTAANGSMPTGIVTFYDGTTSIGTATPANGVATMSTTTLAAGTHSITASLAATSGFAAATSSAVKITIT